MEVKPKKKRSIWILLAIFFIIMAIVGRCSHSDKDKTPATPATPVKTQQQIDDENRKANNERIIAESNQAQAQAKAKSNASYNATNVSSNSTSMSFSDCKNQQASAVLQLAGTANKTMTIMNSSEASIIKICTSDGAVLVTCSAGDGKMVTKKTDNTTGC